MGVADAVQSVRLAVTAAGRAGDRECLPALLQRLGVLSQLAVVPADRVEGDRLTQLVAGRPVEGSRQSGVGQRVGRPGLPVVEQRDVEVGVGPAGVVAVLVEQIQRRLQMAQSVVVGAQVGVGVGEQPLRPGLRRPVAEALRCDHRDVLRGHPVAPVTAPVEVGGQASRAARTRTRRGRLPRRTGSWPAAPDVRAANHAIAASRSANGTVTTPGRAGASASGSRCGDSSIAAPCALCR